MCVGGNLCVCVCNQRPQLPYAISALLEHTINTWGGTWLHCSSSKSPFAFAQNLLVFFLPHQMTNLSLQCQSKSYSNPVKKPNSFKCR